MEQGKWIVGFLLSGLLLSITFVTGYRYGADLRESADVGQVDTMYVRDTIVSEKPVFVERTKVERVTIEVRDTIRQNDTLYVYMDREQVVWQDSLSRVYASGILPQVDSVVHYINERVVTREVIVPQVKRTRWGVGINAGYGFGLNAGKVVASPYIGIGVSYNIITW